MVAIALLLFIHIPAKERLPKIQQPPSMEVKSVIHLLKSRFNKLVA